MKKILLLLSIFVISSCSPESDFRSVRWGMSLKQVKKAEKKVQMKSSDRDTDEIVYTLTFLKKRCGLHYFFKKKQLIASAYMFPKNSFRSSADLRFFLKRVVKLYDSKYKKVVNYRLLMSRAVKVFPRNSSIFSLLAQPKVWNTPRTIIVAGVFNKRLIIVNTSFLDTYELRGKKYPTKVNILNGAKIISARATSTLASKDGKYSVNKLFDNNDKTCWAEGVDGPGIGTKIYITYDKKVILNILRINNGLGIPKYYKKNNRVKELRINGQLVKLKDQMFEWIRLKKTIVAKQLVFEILSVYKNEKWDDTCLSEIYIPEIKGQDYFSNSTGSLLNKGLGVAKLSCETVLRGRPNESSPGFRKINSGERVKLLGKTATSGDWLKVSVKMVDPCRGTPMGRATCWIESDNYNRSTKYVDKERFYRYPVKDKIDQQVMPGGSLRILSRLKWVKVEVLATGTQGWIKKALIETK